MANYPEPREIPAGKILIAEYGSAEAKQRAVVEKIAAAPPRAGLQRSWFGDEIMLVWSSPGFQPAGSCMTWTNGFWAVWFHQPDGTRHGRRYTPDAAGEAVARTHFASLTTAA